MTLTKSTAAEPRSAHPAKAKTRYRHALLVAIAVQLLAVAVATFGDIGFDRPGRYGLSFGHLVFFVAPAWCVATLVGLHLSLRISSRVFVVQALLFCMPFMWLFAAAMRTDATPPAATSGSR